VVGYCGWVVNFIEAHHVRDHLFIDVCLTIALDEIHQDLDGTPCLIAEYLASGNVIRSHNIGGLVLLDIT